MDSRAGLKHFTFGLPLRQNKRFTFNFLFVKRQNFVLALPAQITGLQFVANCPIGYTPFWQLAFLVSIIKDQSGLSGI